jgi:hypothetical protein
MDEVEKRILGYVISAEFTGILAIINIFGILYNVNPEVIAVIDGLLGPVVAGMIAWIRYKYKINIDIPGVPEIPVDTGPMKDPTPETIEGPTPEPAVIDPPAPLE